MTQTVEPGELLRLCLGRLAPAEAGVPMVFRRGMPGPRGAVPITPGTADRALGPESRGWPTLRVWHGRTFGSPVHRRLAFPLH